MRRPKLTAKKLARLRGVALQIKKRQEEANKPHWIFDREIAAKLLEEGMAERRKWAGPSDNIAFLVLTAWRYMGRQDSEPLSEIGCFDHGASDEIENTIDSMMGVLDHAPLSFLLFALMELDNERAVHATVRRLWRLYRKGEWP